MHLVSHTAGIGIMPPGSVSRDEQSRSLGGAVSSEARHHTLEAGEFGTRPRSIPIAVQVRVPQRHPNSL